MSIESMRAAGRLTAGRTLRLQWLADARSAPPKKSLRSSRLPAFLLHPICPRAPRVSCGVGRKVDELSRCEYEQSLERLRVARVDVARKTQLSQAMQRGPNHRPEGALRFE